jgi:hypothetical protein
MYNLPKATKKHTPISSETIHSSRTNKNYPTTQRGISHAQITKQNFYAPTNTEQETHTNQSHQQTNDMQDLKKHYEKPV